MGKCKERLRRKIDLRSIAIVCVLEREREREREGKCEYARERESVCVSVERVCGCQSACVSVCFQG